MIFSLSRLYSFFVLFFLVVFSSSVLADAGLRHGKRPPQKKIVGGVDAVLKHWPGQVALKLQNPEKPESLFFCGGTAIAPNWVLTAAHCFDGLHHSSQKSIFARKGFKVETKRGIVNSSGWKLEILGGTDDLAKRDKSNIKQVEKVIVHPDYNAATMFYKGYDIALVKLASPLPEPYAVLSLDPDTPYPAGELAQVAGFGLLQENALVGSFNRSDKSQFYAGSDKLQQVRLPVIEKNQCQRANQMAGEQVIIGDGQICAGLEKGGKDSCQADSGGPLILLSPEYYPYQIGLVSWGAGCARAASYGVYTRLAHYGNFIRRHVSAVQTVDHMRKNEAQKVRENLDFANQALRELAQELGEDAQQRVTVSLLDDKKRPFRGTKVRLGDEFVFQVQSQISGRLVLLDINAKSKITPIFPNKFVKSNSVGFIRQDKTIKVPDWGYGFDAFQASTPLGNSRLLALVLPPDFDVERILVPLQAKSKGFTPVKHEKSYLMNALHQILHLFRLRSGGIDRNNWGMTVLDYEVVR